VTLARGMPHEDREGSRSWGEYAYAVLMHGHHGGRQDQTLSGVPTSRRTSQDVRTIRATRVRALDEERTEP
jgi:hypothetical protein